MTAAGMARHGLMTVAVGVPYGSPGIICFANVEQFDQRMRAATGWIAIVSGAASS